MMFTRAMIKNDLGRLLAIIKDYAISDTGENLMFVTTDNVRVDCHWIDVKDPYYMTTKKGFFGGREYMTNRHITKEGDLFW